MTNRLRRSTSMIRNGLHSSDVPSISAFLSTVISRSRGVEQGLHVLVGLTRELVGLRIAVVEPDLHRQEPVVANVVEGLNQADEVAPALAGWQAIDVGKVDVAQVLTHPVDVVGRDLVAVHGMDRVEHQLDVWRVDGS